MGLVDVVIGIFVALIADEILQWSPRFARWIVGKSAALVPSEYRERFVEEMEEWAPKLDDIPGRISRVIFAFETLRAAVCLHLEFRKSQSKEQRESPEIERISVREKGLSAVAKIHRSEGQRRICDEAIFSLEEQFNELAGVRYQPENFPNPQSVSEDLKPVVKDIKILRAAQRQIEIIWEVRRLPRSGDFFIIPPQKEHLIKEFETLKEEVNIWK